MRVAGGTSAGYKRGTQRKVSHLVLRCKISFWQKRCFGLVNPPSWSLPETSDEPSLVAKSPPEQK
jgi:hypothetical protein